MIAPKLYTVRKFALGDLIEHDFSISMDGTALGRFSIRQQDNALFRQVRIITSTSDALNPYVVFVDCKGGGGEAKVKQLSNLVTNGFALNGTRFVMCERSASMTRTGILSFIDAKIEAALFERITLGVKASKRILSKYYAYRGLAFSSCHCLEGYMPKIIIVPDYYRVIPGQRIKYAYDREIDFVDKSDQQRVWIQKDIAVATRDITINTFDGCGIHHPAISRQIEVLVGSDVPMTSVVWRAPFIKGVTHEIDYERFFTEKGITEIADVWGVKHSVTEPMIIMTESMYKGKSYLAEYGDARDWREYWQRFKKYGHCIGISKANFGFEEEPIYTRGNYQILQDLDLPFDEFASLADYSLDYYQRIVEGELIHTYCFLGITADNHKPLNSYCKAVLKNPEMLKEYGVRQYLISLLDKYLDGMKCGKIYLRSCFKFLAPDLLMLLEHVGGLPVSGCLEADEFYTRDKAGAYSGERLITRNPHICKSEHVILNAVSNPFIAEYCSHLANFCMINGKSITPQRLNGADYDGDLVLVIDDKRMMAGVDRDLPVVIDIEDKATAKAEDDTPQNRLELVLRSMNSLIGETSNCATGFHNKTPGTQEQRDKYDSFIDLLSIINGKAIDYAKTGVLYNIPKHIAKYSKPAPYFMKYTAPYYARLTKLGVAPSNMNRLCWFIEKWSKNYKRKRTFKDFDYSIMIDQSIPINEERFSQIEAIYLDYCREMCQLGKDQRSINAEDTPFAINWGYYHNLYKEKCLKICPDHRELANYAVMLCYERYPNKTKKFLWRVTDRGIIDNIEQVEVLLPQRDDSGPHKYLGRRYKLTQINEGDIKYD